MVNSCSSYNCTQRYEKGISFHRFPRDPIILQKWVIAMRRDNWFPTKNDVLCSNHFTEDCYDISGWSSRRTLRVDAIPSKFDFSDRSNVARRKCSRKRLKEVEEITDEQKEHFEVFAMPLSISLQPSEDDAKGVEKNDLKKKPFCDPDDFKNIDALKLDAIPSKFDFSDKSNVARRKSSRKRLKEVEEQIDEQKEQFDVFAMPLSLSLQPSEDDARNVEKNNLKKNRFCDPDDFKNTDALKLDAIPSKFDFSDKSNAAKKKSSKKRLKEVKEQNEHEQNEHFDVFEMPLSISLQTSEDDASVEKNTLRRKRFCYPGDFKNIEIGSLHAAEWEHCLRLHQDILQKKNAEIKTLKQKNRRLEERIAHVTSLLESFLKSEEMLD